MMLDFIVGFIAGGATGEGAIGKAAAALVVVILLICAFILLLPLMR
jgi:hypothetical protein